jgi:hypothetical protein
VGLENQTDVCKYRYVFEAENRQIVFAGVFLGGGGFESNILIFGDRKQPQKELIIHHSHITNLTRYGYTALYEVDMTW